MAGLAARAPLSVSRLPAEQDDDSRLSAQSKSSLHRIDKRGVTMQKGVDGEVRSQL